MNKKTLLALIGIILALLTHAYLTNHHYSLKYGVASAESLCQLGDKLDCDAAAASSYSTVAGIPLSVFGLAFHGVLLLLLLGAWMGVIEKRERAMRLGTALSGLSVLASVALAVISATQLSAWCPFCILAYVWSIIIFLGFWLSLEEPIGQITADIPAFFTESKSLLIMLLLIPAGAFFADKAIIQNFGGEQLDVVVRSAVNEWKVNPAVDFSDLEPALVKGPPADKATMTLVEFADFRCGHCGKAAPSVHAFLKGHSDVRFMFYNFPLDGECNSNIGSGDGISCRLAKAVTCAAEEEQKKGFALHDSIFKNQAKYQTTRSTDKINELLKAEAEGLGLGWEKLDECINSPETHEKIVTQVKAGLRGKIRGTPTFFVDGKLLSRGQFIPVLKAVHEANLN